MTRREIAHAWTEEGELPGKVTLEFAGVNTATFEAMEIQNFQRGLSELTGRARDKGDVVPERITVELTSDALTVQGTTIPRTSIPMREIAEVLAAPRLGWRDRSGRFVQQAHSLSGYRGG